MRTIEMSGQRPPREIRKGRSLDPENHSQQAWWRTKRNGSRRRNVRPCISQAELGNLCGGNLLRKSVSGTRGCGYALRPLLEAAAMLFLARHTAGSELDRNAILGVAKPRTTRMAGRHGVVVSALMLSHFPRCMHMAGMHEDHRRHGHLCPSHHGYEQRRRNGLLYHAVSVWQTKRSHAVMKITPGFDSSECLIRTTGLSHQILQRRLQLTETKPVSAGPELPRLNPL